MDLDLMFDSFEPFEDVLDQMADGGVAEVGLETGPAGEDAFLGDPDVGAELGSLGASAYTKPNVFGGQDTLHEDGSITWTRPNVFGGQDIHHPDGSTSYTKPNIFGGQDILTLGQSADGSASVEELFPEFSPGEDFQETFQTESASDVPEDVAAIVDGATEDFGDVARDAVENLQDVANEAVDSLQDVAQETVDGLEDVSHDLAGNIGALARQQIDNMFRWTFAGDMTFETMNADELVEGGVDPVHGGVVHGNVQQDAELVDQQTGPTCALMAQEQFLEKYFGVDIPEGELAAFASEMNVFDPEGGTVSMGWDIFLDHVGISHENLYNVEMDSLIEAVKAGKDVFVPVNFDSYMEDPYSYPGGGHAVVITGWNGDPDTGEVRGFYINDSNFAGTPVYKTVEEFGECWQGHMISVPDITMKI